MKLRIVLLCAATILLGGCSKSHHEQETVYSRAIVNGTQYKDAVSYAAQIFAFDANPNWPRFQTDEKGLAIMTFMLQNAEGQSLFPKIYIIYREGEDFPKLNSPYPIMVLPNIHNEDNANCGLDLRDVTELRRCNPDTLPLGLAVCNSLDNYFAYQMLQGTVTFTNQRKSGKYVGEYLLDTPDDNAEYPMHIKGEFNVYLDRTDRLN